jgi:hypothetical protein
MSVSFPALHYCQSAVLLQITVGQLSCSTLLSVSCPALHYCRLAVLFYISCLPFIHFLLRTFGKKLRRPILAWLYLSVSVRKYHSASDRDFLKFSSWANQEIPWFLLNVSFHYHVQYTCHLFVCCAKSVHSTNSHLISLDSLGLLFSHLSVFLPSSLFLWAKRIKVYLYLCTPPYFTHASPI